jgi:hypothetical protein
MVGASEEALLGAATRTKTLTFYFESDRESFFFFKVSIPIGIPNPWVASVWTATVVGS